MMNYSAFKHTKKFDVWEQRTMTTKINGLKKHKEQ